MHGLRSAIFGEGEARYSDSPVVTKEPCRRGRAEGLSLAGVAIPRQERRVTNQRAEDRKLGLIDRATILFRRKKTMVRVVNVSPGGVMIESGIEPRIGERIAISIEGQPTLDGAVRWVRSGRIGLDVGENAIDVD